MWPTVAVLIVADLCSQPVVGSTDVPVPIDTGQGRPQLCGPKCVQSITRWYGRYDDLADVAAETNDRFDQPATLEALEAALNRRGIHTLALRVRPGVRVHWPSPIVIHLERPDNSAGHFRVWQPIEGSDGCSVESNGDLESDSWRLRPSGVLLLTSSTPIDPSAVSVTASDDSGTGRWPILLAVCVLGAVVTVIAAGSFRRVRARNG
jgi:hypothetical protein